jgi:cytoskeletal protein RodZ
MCHWDDKTDGARSRRYHKENQKIMKKIMGVLLSTSLFLGAVSVVFAQGTGTGSSTSTSTKKAKKEKKKSTSTSTATKS